LDTFETDTEIFEFAVDREVQAYSLYMTLASKINDDELRRIFQTFAAEELGHKERLELEIIKLGKSVDQSVPEVDEIEVEIDQDIDYKDILVMAIGKEGEAFRVYVDLSQLVTDARSRELLLKLAEEEAKHKARFELEYDHMITG
jgi:rubrerythrin